MATATLDLQQLLEGIPTGAWVAISEARHKVMAFGADAQSVAQQAKLEGEEHPLMVRVNQARIITPIFRNLALVSADSLYFGLDAAA